MSNEFNDYNQMLGAENLIPTLNTDSLKPEPTTPPTQSTKIQPNISVSQTDKNIPHNLEIETSLIGAILRNSKLLEQAESLRYEYFYAPENQIIFKWILDMSSHNQIASPKTLAHLADSEPAIASLGGKNYLAKIASDVFNIINIKEYSTTIEDLYRKRQLIGIGEEIILDGYNQDIENTAEKQIEKAEQSLYTLAETGEAKKQIINLGEALGKSIENAEKAFKNPSGLVGITTGFTDMDGKLGGLHGSDLIILAGRPAMGKTSLATNLAFNAAKAYTTEVDEDGNKTSNGGVVLFFSLEMSAEQLATRIISEQAEISSDKIRRGEINAEQFTKLADSANNLTKTQLYIDDTPGISVTALRQKARRIKRQHGLDLIVIDYLQLLQGPAGKKFDGNNRVNEISEITRTLKIIAKELDLPVLALSQLSREVEKREDKRPQLSDLRESGSIEQDADVVMFIFREEYYLKKNAPERYSFKNEKDFEDANERYNEKINNTRNKAEIIIAKQRHGPVGPIDLFFNGEFTRFGDLDEHH